MPHCIDRALERYGLVLTISDLKALQAQVRPVTCLKKFPDGSQYHALSHNGVAMIACVIGACEGMPRIVTFLPADYFSAENRRDGRQRRKFTKGKKLSKAAHADKVKMRHQRRALADELG